MSDEEIAESLPVEQELPSAEKEALSKGWVPLDKFEGPKEKFKSAELFLEKGEMLNTIHSMKQQLKEQKEALEHVVAVNSRIEEITAKKMLKELEDRQRMAAEVGDVATVQQVTKEIVNFSNSAPVPPSPDKALVDDFIERNRSWYNNKSAENSSMKIYAEQREPELVRENPGLSLKDILAKVEEDVRDRFPKKFDKPYSMGNYAVSAPTAPIPKEQKLSLKSLHPSHVEIVKVLKRTVKNFDEQDYIKRVSQYKDQLAQ